MTNEQLQQLGHIVNSPLFVPESVREVSKACESLCRWVQAVYECCCMQNHPAAVHASEVLARELHVQLHLAKEHEKDVFRHVEDVKHQLQLVHADLENQLLELRSAQTAETEAAGALRGLETHVTLWRASAQVTQPTFYVLLYVFQVLFVMTLFGNLNKRFFLGVRPILPNCTWRCPHAGSNHLLFRPIWC